MIDLCGITPITTPVVGVIVLLVCVAYIYMARDSRETNLDKTILVLIILSIIYSIHNILMTTFCGVNCNNN